MPSSRSAIIWSLVWNLLEKCSVQLVTFVVTIVLARILLPEEYGIVALITIFIALSNVIIDGGLNTALVQKKNVDNADFSTIFFVSIALSVVLYCVLFFTAPFLSEFYGINELIPVLRVLALSLVFYAINSIQRAYVYKHMLFRKMFFCSLAGVVLSGVIGISMACCGYGVWALVLQTIANIALTAVFMWIVVRWRPVLMFSADRFKALFSFGWKIFVTNFIITLFIKLRTLVIGKTYTPEVLAYYDKGNQFPGLIMDNVCGTIQTVLFPAFSEIQDDKAKVKSMMRRSINVSCLLMFPLMIGLLVCAKPLVLLILTDKWLPCVPFLQIISLSNLFRPITIPNGQAITAMGYSNITLKLEIIRKIVDVIILAVSCRLGVIAVAWGVVVFNVICLFINLRPNERLLGYKIWEQINDVLPLLLISLVMGALIYCFSMIIDTIFLLICVQVMAGTVIYISLCWLFKVESFFYLLGLIKSRNFGKRFE